MFGYKKLIVWQKSMDLTEKVYALIRSLPSEVQYGKPKFRAEQAALSYPEKVRQVVAMQERMRPIYAARGRIIVPWKLG